MKKATIFIAIIIVIVLIPILVDINTKSNKVTYKERVIYKKEKAKNLQEIKQTENIVFLGDSITDFYPIDNIFDNLPIVKSGVSGYTTQDILERMDSMVYQYNPTRIFLLIGTNDLIFDDLDDKEKIINNIKKIIENIKDNRKNAKIYLESIYPVNKSLDKKMVNRRDNETISSINNELKKYCDDNHVVFIDMYKKIQDEEGNFDKKYTDDGLHPNALGYARISQIRLNYIYDIDISE